MLSNTKFGNNYTPKKAYKKIFIDCVEENENEEVYENEMTRDSRKDRLLKIKL